MKPDEGHMPATYNLSARRKSEIHDTLAPAVTGLKRDGDLASKPRIQMPLGAGDSKMGSKLNLVEAGMLAASVDATRQEFGKLGAVLSSTRLDNLFGSR